jgi:hypothetical protein
MAKNSDYRISTCWRKNIKRKKLKIKLGNDGIVAIMDLWAYMSECNPDGCIGDSKLDIECKADWEGEENLFADTLIKLKLIDKIGNNYHIHDWEENNPWAAKSKERSENARHAARMRHAQNKQCGDNADSNAPFLSSPDPTKPNHPTPHPSARELKSDDEQILYMKYKDKFPQEDFIDRFIEDLDKWGLVKMEVAISKSENAVKYNWIRQYLKTPIEGNKNKEYDIDKALGL